ncbi:MAG: class I SAM-dependent DNA methyltransferase, partial [Muribaculaceae bacterium]|nr:class I SAM-dependent DNA methyltransferase [Muribaculaceae bacterium]
IIGNPPYLGNVLQNQVQKSDLQIALKELKDKKGLDYIGAWFWLGSKYILNSKAKYAFVTTNSISQGEQVAMLWKPILNLDLEIFFARTSFKWSNNAKYNAAVTVAIIGVRNKSYDPKYIFKEREYKVIGCDNIGPYLFPGETAIIEKRYTPLVNVAQMQKGSMPADNGALVLTSQGAEDCIKRFPDLNRYIKSYLGSDEFINCIERFCFWIEDNEYYALKNHTYLVSRFQICTEFRAKSSKATTRLIASEPYRFDERRYKPTDAIIVPSVSSERREYVPIGYVDKNTVISNAAFAIYDAEKWLFALLTSKMHNLWVRTVGGRLKTDIRYSATLCYNTFPFPKLTASEKEELERLAQNILNIRDENFDMTLGEMYNPESMPEELREAHHQLDLAVERIYRPEPFTSDEERLEHLFKLYAKMTKK